MSLQALKRRLKKVEAKAACKALHVVMVFTGTPELDAQAERAIAQGESDTRRMNKELRIFEIEVSSTA
jgi:hypothetical protein